MKTKPRGPAISGAPPLYESIAHGIERAIAPPVRHGVATEVVRQRGSVPSFAGVRARADPRGRPRPHRADAQLRRVFRAQARDGRDGSGASTNSTRTGSNAPVRRGVTTGAGPGRGSFLSSARVAPALDAPPSKAINPYARPSGWPPEESPPDGSAVAKRTDVSF